ncbi:general secretion pathway protein GspA [Vibrio sp. 10N.261.46.E8]|nr:general secretion pathway protein GspA [Vibrio sp. 10N.261.45.E1]PMJ23491.1 general secretion pathway protein GspA [Vibrio sp. 10N.286.45.B6]PML87453.1 general secretion pathway protein GspA [Vibrio sp. 10N.261.49.E11]PMM73834.1 general secretion pathway protein GspA [Vibrio sp. 10N.261.46.F12]PMM87324.1 general secretion pathway protein GspA [Vibrio sp. 10N.261.46.E8]PMN35333.1 general secretion pathway protein GspA [Vibrio sp. 10N.261.45.E2]PMN49378.1 general secretion pathway protein Gs
MPFSIVPNSRYLFLSQRHQEAMQNLQAGLGEGGGFAMLTGEVGTGKTTVAKAMLSSLDSHTQAGLILNPTFSNTDLLEAICDEFEVDYPEQASLKQLSQAIHHFLLDSHAEGIQTLLVIDEAQHLAADVLEQLRLLTNLETDSRKLLKVLLVGQPELQQHLQTTQLRQLAQRITGRYHLLPLNTEETGKYIAFRLETAGGEQMLFSNRSIKLIAQYTHGIPRLINLVCDKALQLAFHDGEQLPSNETVNRACQQVMSFQADVYHVEKPRTSHVASKIFQYAGIATLSVGLAVATFNFAPTYINSWLPADTANEVRTEVAARTQRSLVADAPMVAVEPKTTKFELPYHIQQHLMQGTNRSLAIKDLYTLWGYQSSLRDGLCLSEPQSVFVCEQQQANLDTLLQLGVPVVLNLDIEKKSVFAVLYGVSEDSVELLVNEKLLVMPKQSLEQIWQGDYVAIWKQPLRETLKEGYQGEAVALLDLLLSEVLGEGVSGSDVFDYELKMKIEAFQTWQGMSVDGIAGKRTLARLQRLAQLDSPKLMSLEGGES